MPISTLTVPYPTVHTPPLYLPIPLLPPRRPAYFFVPSPLIPAKVNALWSTPLVYPANIFLPYAVGILDQDLRSVGIHAVDQLRNLLAENVRNLDAISSRLEQTIQVAARMFKQTVALVVLFQFTWFIFQVLMSEYRAHRSMESTLAWGFFYFCVAYIITKVVVG